MTDLPKLCRFDSDGICKSCNHKALNIANRGKKPRYWNTICGNQPKDL